MKFNKLSFIFLTLAFVVLISFNVSAYVTTRSLPTIYKITGDLNLTDTYLAQNPNKSYFLLAYVSSGSANYSIGKSSCMNATNLTEALKSGIFVGPISSTIVGYQSESFDMKIAIRNFASLGQCSSDAELFNITGNTGANYN